MAKNFSKYKHNLSFNGSRNYSTESSDFEFLCFYVWRKVCMKIDQKILIQLLFHQIGMHMRKAHLRVILITIIAIIVIFTGIGVGSVFIHPMDVLKVFIDSSELDPLIVSIVWSLRTPRVLLAFLVGAALGASGAVMQSVLRNPLASSYTIGVSSGASLGVSLIFLSGFGFATSLVPLFGLIGGMLTVFIVVFVSSKMDKHMMNHTVILFGIVFSLFINAIQTLLVAFSRDGLERLILWQLGSFALREWSYVIMMAPVTIIGVLFLYSYSKELDIMTFGEDQALSLGVELKQKKWHVLLTSGVLAGCSVAFAGVIGFVDLISPHVIRKLFGSSHRYIVPMSAIFGGTFLVLADILARTIIPLAELPVGAVTAVIGAPFFAYVYFRGKKY